MNFRRLIGPMLNRIAPILLLVGCTTLPNRAAPAPTPVDITPYLTNATRLTEEKLYSAALAELDIAIKLDTRNPIPHIEGGQIYLQQHRWSAAQLAFERAITLDSQNYDATLGLAEALLQQEMESQSATQWLKANQLDAARPDGWVGLGRTYLKQQVFDKAKEAFSRANSISAEPQAQWFLAALTLPEDREVGLSYLAQIKGDWPQRDYLLATINALPSGASQAETAAITGIAMIQLDELELAFHALNASTRLEPSDAQTWAFLGHAQAELGLPALESFNTAAELDPDQVLTLYFEGIYLRQQDHYDLALERLSRGLELDPGNLAISLEIAQTLAANGDLASAEAWFRAVVEAEPESVAYQQLLTEFFVERSYRVAESGLVEAERLLVLAPNSARAFDLLGWAKFQTGDYSGAETTLKQAIEIDPANISARYHLSQLLNLQRRNTEAQAEITRIIDWDTSGTYRDRVSNKD